MKVFRKAILIVHGFAGATFEQEKLANSLELERNFDVFTFTLPGHDFKDKKKTTSKMWIEECENQVEILINAGYKNIYIIGHSMGGIISSYLATKYKEIKRVVLLAPAFSSLISKEEGGIINALKHGSEILKNYDWNDIMMRANKLPISAVKEFFELVENYKDYVYKIKVPILILHGSKDNVVPIESSRKVYDELEVEKKVFIITDGCDHNLFTCKKTNQNIVEVKRFLKSNKLCIKEESKKI